MQGLRVHRFVLVDELTVDLDALDLSTCITLGTLNSSFEFIRAYKTQCEASSAHQANDSTYVCVRVPSVANFVRYFQYLEVKHLKHLCELHGIAFSSRFRKPQLQLLLLSHECTDLCSNFLYIMHSLNFHRAIAARVGRYELNEQRLGATINTQKSRARAQRTGRQLENNETVSVEGEPNYAGPSHSNNLSNDATMESDLDEDVEVNQGVQTGDVEMQLNDDASGLEDNFPFFADIAFKREIIQKWQNRMDLRKWIPVACAVCGQACKKEEIKTIELSEEKLELLQNGALPQCVLPQSYNFEAYNKAILHPKGLTNTNIRAPLNVCGSCRTSLRNTKQPLDSLANFQYYGWERLPENVQAAMNNASIFDLMLIAKARCSRINHLFVKNPNSTMYGGNPATSQRYSRGNVAIIPQDSVQLRNVLPPSPEEVQKSMCVLFVGGNKAPTRANIATFGSTFGPVLVSKNRVSTIINFLIGNNPWYQDANTEFSEENLNALYSSDALPSNTSPSGSHVDNHNVNEGLPAAIDIGHLESNNGDEPLYATSDYTDRNESTPENESTDFLIDAIGYSDADSSSQQYQSMKADALAWCLDNKKFLNVRGGTQLLNDNDPSFLAFAFPHLDPWGIGGFNNPKRSSSQKLSFSRQLKNMIKQYDSPFQKDPNFAFVCWNILQKMEVRKKSMFSVKESTQHQIALELKEVSNYLQDLAAKWEHLPRALPVTEQEKKAFSVLQKLRVINRDLKGTMGYKLCRRNEVRALIKTYSTPALFITLNPSDVNHPLIAALGGIPQEEWKNMSSFDRKVFVAKNPAIAAQFFDEMIKAFIEVVLKYGHGTGLFGKCSAYYGMVEAQGKGTLHCHMLIWIEGNPSPQELRDRMAESPEFKNRMFKWLEENISSHIPGSSEVTEQLPGQRMTRPKYTSHNDPRANLHPIVHENFSNEDFQTCFKEFVTELAKACNWHEHNETCWKHLDDSDPKDDAHCRMRLNGQTRALTEIDPETQSILLRRLHPWINNFNDLILFLLQCNMDIKYVGSGEAAKALVYYVTDYITKECLPTHAGLSALLYAVRQNAKKFGNTVITDEKTIDRSLIIKCVNAIAGKQEVSHQQVMSYIIGGGDYYTSHTFCNLKWVEFRNMINKFELNNSNADLNENVTLSINNGHISLSNHTQDYCYRPHSAPFDGLSLWDFIAQTEKISRKKEEDRQATHDQTESSNMPPPGPIPTTRGFFDNAHPSQATQMLRIRSSSIVPVLIGPSLPRPDRNEEEFEEWCKIMLLLFKPWRVPSDLKPAEVPWSEAFIDFQISPTHNKIIDNMSVENECRDAREHYNEIRKHDKTKSLILNSEVGDVISDTDNLAEALLNDSRLNDFVPESFDEEYMDQDEEILSNANAERSANEIMEHLNRIGIFNPSISDNNSSSGHNDNGTDNNYEVALITDNERQIVQVQAKLMSQFKKRRQHSSLTMNATQNAQPHTSLQGSSVASTSASQLPYSNILNLGDMPNSRQLNNTQNGDNLDHNLYGHLHDIIHEMNLDGNEEQQLALRILAEHFITKDSTQLLLYVSGVGGTGKSYVIKTISELMTRHNDSHKLLRTAPTGCAAVLIEGHTIHSVTMLPSRKKKINIQELEMIWHDIQYLIIDEVSMISGSFLYQISQRLQHAFGSDPSRRELPFGGVNIIFTGDLGQLPPVGEHSLFSDKLVDHLPPNIRNKPSGQKAVYGASLWRNVINVVELKQNWRSKKDANYTDLLNRIRTGNTNKQEHAVENGVHGYNKPDYEVLLSRVLQTLKNDAPNDLEALKGAPIIVADKVLRDRLNIKMVQKYAQQTDQTVHIYHAKDKHKRKAVPVDDQHRLWKLGSSTSKDALGMLPLVPGMKVMVTENVATSQRVVNGAEGTLKKILYETDGEGHRYAVCAYVHIPNSNIRAPGLQPDIVPLIPVSTNFTYLDRSGKQYGISRSQLPLVPAYSYTDFKSQGRTLKKAIVDLRGSRTLQSVYVMLSRVGSLSDLGILQWFTSNKINQRLKRHYRLEFERISCLAEETKVRFAHLKDKQGSRSV